MTNQQRRGILDAIWPSTLNPGLQVFAVLDGARDRRISWELDSTFCEHDCLYAGDLPQQLRSAAPYLVQLDRDDRLAAFILDNGWGKNWGVFLRSDIGIRNLRKHLRGFLRVKDEHGNRLLFRYYDPRVLKLYLPTCTAAELHTVFGPIHSIVMETAGGESAAEMIFDGKALQQSTLSIQHSPLGATMAASR
jgi:hypothetical protein